MNKTGIEWVKNPDGSRPGWSWNPVTGCLNHKDGFCNGGGFKCYAYRLANGRLKPLYRQNRNTAPLPFPQGGEYGIWHLVEALADPFYPRFWPERLASGLRGWGILLTNCEGGVRIRLSIHTSQGEYLFATWVTCLALVFPKNGQGES